MYCQDIARTIPHIFPHIQQKPSPIERKIEIRCTFGPVMDVKIGHRSYVIDPTLKYIDPAWPD